MKKVLAFSVSIMVLAVGGCRAWSQNEPVRISQSDHVGINLGGSGADRSADISVGLANRKVASVPVTVPQGDGGASQIVATANGKSDQQDAISVLGQWAPDVENEALGSFFSLGEAAKALAKGYNSKLRSEALEEF